MKRQVIIIGVIMVIGIGLLGCGSSETVRCGGESKEALTEKRPRPIIDAAQDSRKLLRFQRFSLTSCHSWLSLVFSPAQMAQPFSSSAYDVFRK